MVKLASQFVNKLYDRCPARVLSGMIACNLHIHAMQDLGAAAQAVIGNLNLWFCCNS